MSEQWDTARAVEIISQFTSMRGALLPVLHALQEEFGYVDETVIPDLAKAFNLSRADVHGVITFYHDFKRTRPGRHTIKVCRAESCQSMGAEALIDDIERRLGVTMGETTADGQFTLEQVFCLGNCALSPALMMDKTVYGKVTPERFDAICQRTRS